MITFFLLLSQRSVGLPVPWRSSQGCNWIPLGRFLFSGLTKHAVLLYISQANSTLCCDIPACFCSPCTPGLYAHLNMAPLDFLLVFIHYCASGLHTRICRLVSSSIHSFPVSHLLLSVMQKLFGIIFSILSRPEQHWRWLSARKGSESHDDKDMALHYSWSSCMHAIQSNTIRQRVKLMLRNVCLITPGELASGWHWEVNG